MGDRLTDKELKEVLISILDEIDQFCKEKNLSYFLAYGSLIGAIRHKGFIPWDDDVDICMPRADYEKMIRGYNLKCSGTTCLISPETDADYYLNSAKVIDTRTVLKEHISTKKTIGVYVDVYPIDNCSDDYKLALKQHKKIKNLKRILSLKNCLQISPERSTLKNTVIIIIRVLIGKINTNKLIGKIINVSKHYNWQKESKYAGVISESDIYGEREIMPAEWFKGITEAEFEGHIYNIPVHYDNILRQLYGDYMTPPPPEKQISHHSFDAWWK